MKTIIPDAMWYGASVCDQRVVGLYARHYSAEKNGKTIRDWLRHGIAAPGEKIVLLTFDVSALFVWLRQKYIDSDQFGVNCAVFRNEGNYLSSELILAAEKIAWKRWPGERLYTYVDPGKIMSDNPGYCFKAAGWALVRNADGSPKTTSHDLIILEKIDTAPEL